MENFTRKKNMFIVENRRSFIRILYASMGIKKTYWSDVCFLLIEYLFESTSVQDD